MTERKSGFGRVGLILLFAVGFLFSSLELSATHLRAGQITVEPVGSAGCFSREFKITITVYTDTRSSVRFGGDGELLDFGDGSQPQLIPKRDGVPLSGVDNVNVVEYITFHTYPGPGQYIISYKEANRNANVLNMDNSVFTTFYLETMIDLTVLNCSSSPVLRIPPIDEACSGVAFMHNPGARDADGDSLSYEFVTPYQDEGTPVLGYNDPNHTEFYSGLDYNLANEAGNGPPTFTIDHVDGTVIWDAPGAIGEYNIAFVVKEWRKIGGVWTVIGFVRRDMQIIVSEDCLNDRPQLEIPKDTCIVAGELLTAVIIGKDIPQNRPVKIEAFSEIFDDEDFDPPFATVTPGGVYQPSVPQAELDFSWQTECQHVKDQPYLVVFKITDQTASGGTGLVTFDTWRIKVIAPAPQLLPVTLDAVNRRAVLNWQPYDCFQQAGNMQIWRRVDDTNFTPDDCQTGMPESLGFTLIAEIPIKIGDGPGATPVTTYTDHGLVSGARYCYRLVAVFPAPRGGESQVSNEECTGPILTSEPVITKVSVEKTGESDGEIRVDWTPPLGTTSFTPPYDYQLQRETPTGFINVTPKMNDVFTFTDGGLNTFNQQYKYRVLLYSSESTTTPADTSTVASSVWLDLLSQKTNNVREVVLNWSAEVPWSMIVQDNPLHDIYRGPEGATVLGDMTQIATVDVFENGLTYTDTGDGLPGDSLKGADTYSYAVVTRGSYGFTNASIPNVLVNNSQINRITPGNSTVPCQIEVAAFINDCKDWQHGCGATVFTNTVRWSVPEGTCADDIVRYRLFVASIKDGTYEELDPGVIKRDTFYIHGANSPLPGLRYCYRVAAVNRSGITGELSDPVCNDNCPYYELPNVFSPNGDGCNDLFSAYGVDLDLGETPPPGCTESEENEDKCARFVKRVDFTVFNRWGKEVYHYIGQEGDENTIYIKWDGRDKTGKELAAGIYYYTANVTVDVVDPTERTRLIKGWVHLVR